MKDPHQSTTQRLQRSRRSAGWERGDGPHDHNPPPSSNDGGERGDARTNRSSLPSTNNSGERGDARTDRSSLPSTKDEGKRVDSVPEQDRTHSTKDGEKSEQSQDIVPLDMIQTDEACEGSRGNAAEAQVDEQSYTSIDDFQSTMEDSVQDDHEGITDSRPQPQLT